MNMIQKHRIFHLLTLFVMCAVLVCITSVHAAQLVWTGDEDDAWSNTNNWNPIGLPTADDEAVINNASVANLPVITDDDDIEIFRLTVRITGILTMDGGSINMVGSSGRWRVGWRNGDDSYMMVNGGTINTIYTLQICEDYGASGFLSVSNATVSIGRGITLGAVSGTGTGGEATMIIEPGTDFSCNSQQGSYPTQIRSNGKMTINGGLLNLNNSMTVFDGGMMRVNAGLVQSTDLVIEDGSALVDIHEGMWQISSNVVTTLEAYVADDKLIGYDGGGVVIINYDEPSGITTVTAVPEPAVLGLVFAGLATLVFRGRSHKR